MRYKHSGQRDAGISKATVSAALFQPKAVTVTKKAPLKVDLPAIRRQIEEAAKDIVAIKLEERDAGGLGWLFK